MALASKRSLYRCGGKQQRLGVWIRQTRAKGSEIDGKVK